MSRLDGRAAMQVAENAEQVRRLVPIEYRAERTRTVYDTALYMYEQASYLTDEQVVIVFEALAWARENT